MAGTEQKTRTVEEPESPHDTFEDASESTAKQEPRDLPISGVKLPVATGTGGSAAVNETSSHAKITTTNNKPSDIQTAEDVAQSVQDPTDAGDSTASGRADAPTFPPRTITSIPTVSTESFPNMLSPPPETPSDQPSKRKLFGWLSRHTSNSDKITGRPSPPPLPPRQNTNSSTTPSGMDELTPLGPQRSHRNSLQNRFKLVRLREEAGFESLDAPADVRQEDGREDQGAGAVAVGPSGNGDAAQGRPQRSHSSPISPATPTISESLAPGTAAGTAAGPVSHSQEPVDWDLWQELVYEGPVAVARTSRDQLNQAIAHGIPSAIRGVVWQVLAQSKSDDLEAVYRDLITRGSMATRRLSDLKPRPGDATRRGLDPDNRRESAPPSIKRTTSVEQVQSSASSIHSDVSSPSSSIANGTAGSPVTSHDGSNPEPFRTIQPDPMAEEKRRAKEQAALQKLEKTIRRDLGARTSFSKFLMSANLQDGLFGICKAYALFDDEVGYAQGMNFIAMPLLFNMPEEEAFCLFVRLMNHYKLRDLFIQDMPGLHLHLYQFERLLEDFEPAVYCHLHRRGVTPDLYATQWFLTLFAYRFPLQLVLRIYDLILSEGLEIAILKFGMVLMQNNSKVLLATKDMAELTTFLKERLFDVYIDKSPSASSILESGFFGSAGGIDTQVYRAEALVQDACAIQVTPELLKQYTAEWEEKAREEKEAQATLDALKSTCTALTLQNRQLTERLEKSDAEHVLVASELVRTKVHDQALTDENESLRVQVGELQSIIQSQPGEVEGRLRQEMDRIMKRNIEVQNENRALEEGCAEMERELVQAKMMHAEKHSELDSMKQKWSTITALMSGK